jgi:hypothetical protein
MFCSFSLVIVPEFVAMIAFELLFADQTLSLPENLSCERAVPTPNVETATRAINTNQVVCQTLAGRLIGATSTSFSNDKLTFVGTAIIVARLVAVKPCCVNFLANRLIQQNCFTLGFAVYFRLPEAWQISVDPNDLIREIVATYAKHGWQLRRVLLRPETRAGLEQEKDAFRLEEMEEATVDALWFSRASHNQREAWELRLVAENPFALFETFEHDETEEQRNEMRREMEARLREHLKQ